MSVASSPRRVHEPSTPGNASKRRKTSSAQVVMGAMNLVDSSAQKNRTYIAQQLEGEEKDELASMVADMLRDGDLEKALQAKKMQATARVLGPKLPKTKKGKTFFKMLGRRWDRQAVDAFLGSPLADQKVSTLKELPGPRYQQLVGMALNQDPENEVPMKHRHAAYEGPLIAVCLCQYKALGERLQGLTLKTAQTIAHFYWSKDKPHVITAQWLNVGEGIRIPIPKEEIEEHNDWEIVHAYSLQKAFFRSKVAGRSQLILPLVKKQCPQLEIPDETLPFEFPKGANHFDESLPTPSAPSTTTASHEASSIAVASPQEVAAAGEQSELVDVEEVPPPE